MASYDRPVRNLIPGLNATGHVTHTKHRKLMVTVHHNGGLRLTHDQVLGVWKTRPASAHMDFDIHGDAAQYVELNEYAWACGNTQGNQVSISLELANISAGPNWAVAEETWRAAARFTGWVFAKVIGTRPDSSNVVQHKHWKATLCAGPHMDSVWGNFIALAQNHYDEFVSGGGSTPPPPPSSGGKSVGDIAAEVIAGKWGNGEQRRHLLQNAGYNYDEVQREVNRRLGGGAPAAHRYSIGELAQQVIEGHWGNNPQRRQRLEGAGYNYAAVQAEVNRRLR